MPARVLSLNARYQRYNNVLQREPPPPIPYTPPLPASASFLLPGSRFVFIIETGTVCFHHQLSEKRRKGGMTQERHNSSRQHIRKNMRRRRHLSTEQGSHRIYRIGQQKRVQEMCRCQPPAHREEADVTYDSEFEAVNSARKTWRLQWHNRPLSSQPPPA